MRLRNQLCTWLALTGILALSPAKLAAQTPFEPSLSVLTRGNELLGLRLLQHLQEKEPAHNLVLASLPVTLILGSIQDASREDAMQEQVGAALGWGRYPDIEPGARMLMALFQPSESIPRNSRGGRSSPDYSQYAWVTNSLTYHPLSHGESPFSADFQKSAARFFGVKFLPSSQPSQPLHEAYFRSNLHVRMHWVGNTFLLNPDRAAEFHPDHQPTVTVPTLDSELGMYPHRTTETYEAVELPCYDGSMTVILPLPGNSIADIAGILVQELSSKPAPFVREAGSVSMPAFHLRRQGDLRPALQESGIREPFQRLGALGVVPVYLRDVRQSVDLLVNRDGIRGDAETTAAAMVGGIMAVPKPFHLVLDRPFVFLIHERETGALLYLGVVMNPAEN